MPATAPRAALLATAVAVALSLLPASAALADEAPYGSVHPPVLVPDPPADASADAPAATPTAPAAAPQDDVLMTTDGLDADPLVQAAAPVRSRTRVARISRTGAHGAVVRVTLAAPAGTRVARLSLRGTGASASRLIRVHGSAVLHLHWRLSRAQVRHLAGGARLTVALGARAQSLLTAWSGGVRVPLGA